VLGANLMIASEIRVLHIDDDTSFLEISKELLKDEAFNVETAASVGEALQKIKDGAQYDVIISDYDMPYKNGLDFLKELRATNTEIPFILFTGKGREEIVVQALNLGVDRYIDKHGDPAVVYTELSAAVRQLYDKTQATRKLWESEERFKKMVTNSKDLIMLTQTDGVILYLSPSCTEIIGYAPEELIGTAPWVIHPEDTERAKQVFIKSLTIPESGEIEYRAITKQGQTKWLHHSYAQIIEKDKICQIISVIKDITENKKAEDALKASEIKFSAAFHSSGAALCFSRFSDGLIIDANESFMDLFGYTREELVGKTVTSLGLYADILDREKIVKQALNNKPIKNIEIAGRRKDGTLTTNLFSTKVVHLNGTKYFLTTLIDITSLKKAQATLTLRQKELETFTGLVPNAVTVTDADGKIIYINDLAGKGYGIPQDQIIGMNVANFIIECEREETINYLKTAATGDHVVSKIFHGRRSSGEVFPVDGTAKAIHDEAGNTVGFMIITRDISEKISEEKRINELLSESKKDAARLKESEERYRFVAEHANDIITVTDINGVFKYISPSVKRVLGLEPSDLIGKMSILQLLPPQIISDSNPKMSQLVKTGKLPPLQFPFETPQGKVWLETNINIIHNEAGEITFTAISRDITQRKIIEDQLLESEERYRFVAECAQDLITVTDMNENFLYISPSAEYIIGYKPEVMMQKHHVFDFFHPADIAPFRSHVRALLVKENQPPIEYRFLTKDGRYIWLEAKISVVKEAVGKTKFIGISRDITTSKKNKEQLDEALTQAELLLEKLSVVGGFIRHDVRNKLTNITNILYLARKHANGNHGMLAQIENVNSIVSNVVSILDFSQKYEAVGSQGLSWIKLEDYVKNACSLFVNLKIPVTTQNLNFQVLADSALTEIFHNLIDNSIKYGGEPLSEIKIRTQTVDNGDLCIIYDDNGEGIDPKIKPKLFNKGVGKGTGLGLYLIQRICDVYCWSITEEGTPGQGARFVLVVPQQNVKPLEN
jgi:PAS domain S-box-containing protein